MRNLIPVLVLGCLLPLSGYCSEVVVTTEDVAIKDKALEAKLIKAVKENGSLTSTRQVHSYMIAVLCEYPKKSAKAKPYCTFRRVKAE